MYDFRDKKRNVNSAINYMLNRTLKMFEYKNLPETIPAVELEKLLQKEGFAFVTEVEGRLYAFTGGLGGKPDVYNRPTEIVVSNPALKLNKTYNLESDGVLVLNDYLKMGLVPLIARYSTILNENEITMVLASVGKRVTNLISVSDDNTADSAKQYLEDLEAGKIGVIMESKLYDSLKSKQTNDSGAVRMTDLIELQQYIKASMFNELGLNSNFNMKKERMITDEIEINSESIYPLVDSMLHSRQFAVEKINIKYGTEIEVDFSSVWKEKQQDTTEATEEVDEQEEKDDE